MLSIDRSIIQENNNLLRYNLNYPIVKEQECEKNIINTMNKCMYNDITYFKNSINYKLIDKLFNLDGYKVQILTEYRITFNQNKIISIPIEFSQLIGLYDITYVNSYNYDIALGRKIKLEDMFDKSTNYIDLINKKLQEEYEKHCYEYEIEETNKKPLIYNNEVFYIEKDKIVICYYSDDLGDEISYLIEFEILFSECSGYLSRYAIDTILNKTNI